MSFLFKTPNTKNNYNKLDNFTKNKKAYSKRLEMINKYKVHENYDLLKDEVSKIIYKYPNKIPVIVFEDSSFKYTLDKNKYLIPDELTLAQFLIVLRRRLNLDPEMAIFLFFQDKNDKSNLVMNTLTFSEIYKDYKHNTGFLYCTLCTEDTFG
jgi:hypothetical protein